MNKRELKCVLEILELMVKTEAKVGRFYRACAAKREEESEYWLDLAAEEDGHAGMVMRMISLVTAHPELYTVARTPDPDYYKSFMDWIDSNTGEITNSADGGEKAVKAAQDIENAVYESKFQELVTTSDKEYQTLINEIADQTRRHAAMVKAKAVNLIK